MKILFYPYECQKNKYISIIQQSMRELEIEIYPLDPKNICSWFRPVDAIYLNWFDNLPQSTLKATIYCIIKKVLVRYYKVFGKKTIFVMHNKVSHNTKNRNKSKGLLRWLILNVDRVIILSEKTRNVITELYGENVYEAIEEKIYKIPIPNYINAYNGQGSFSKAKLGIQESEFVFLFIGLIRPYKNIEIMIDAFRKIEQPNIRLIIAGEVENNQYRSVIEEKIDSNKRITSIFEFIPDEDIASLIALSNVMVFPFDLASALNSSSLFLCASFQKTFISSNVESVYELPEENFYHYSYENSENHIQNLYMEMNRCILDEQNHTGILNEKGKRLYDFVEKENSLDIVKDKIRSCLYE